MDETFAKIEAKLVIIYDDSPYIAEDDVVDLITTEKKGFLMSRRIFTHCMSESDWINGEERQFQTETIIGSHCITGIGNELTERFIFGGVGIMLAMVLLPYIHYHLTGRNK